MSLFNIVLVILLNLMVCIDSLLVAMHEKKVDQIDNLEMIQFKKEFKYQLAKMPIMALKKIDMPQELRDLIVKLHIEKNYDEKQCEEMQDYTYRLKKYHGKEISIADLVKLDSKNMKILSEIVGITEKPHLYKELISDKAASLPLWLRYKLGIRCNTSVKLSMLVLQQSGIPKEFQRTILKLHIDTIDTNVNHDKYKVILDFWNNEERLNKNGGIKINVADLMWLDDSDQKKLYSVQKAMQYKDTKKPHLYKELISDKAVSLPLWLRYKLGIHCNKSVKLPMLALQQSGIPKELQQTILKLYIDTIDIHVNHDRYKVILDFWNNEERLNKNGGIKINVADLMWLDASDQKKLYSVQKAMQYKDTDRAPGFLPGSIIDRQYDSILTEEEYKSAISLPYYLRRKAGPNCNVAVQAGKFDFKPEDKDQLFNFFL
ncbi:MAG TPA: hypothetical protein VLB80_00580 [Candidatus Babeliales bacterium]|nr:hypothetical protein [Candidatus Babeliales bacterium]